MKVLKELFGIGTEKTNVETVETVQTSKTLTLDTAEWEVLFHALENDYVECIKLRYKKPEVAKLASVIEGIFMKMDHQYGDSFLNVDKMKVK